MGFPELLIQLLIRFYVLFGLERPDLLSKKGAQPGLLPEATTVPFSCGGLFLASTRGPVLFSCSVSIYW